MTVRRTRRAPARSRRANPMTVRRTRRAPARSRRANPAPFGLTTRELAKLRAVGKAMEPGDYEYAMTSVGYVGVERVGNDIVLSANGRNVRLRTIRSRSNPRMTRATKRREPEFVAVQQYDPTGEIAIGDPDEFRLDTVKGQRAAKAAMRSIGVPSLPVYRYVAGQRNATRTGAVLHAETPVTKRRNPRGRRPRTAARRVRR